MCTTTISGEDVFGHNIEIPALNLELIKRNFMSGPLEMERRLNARSLIKKFQTNNANRVNVKTKTETTKCNLPNH